jgi:phenylalanine ammonia-lyase
VSKTARERSNSRWDELWIDGRRLTLGDVARVARHPGTVRARLTPEATRRASESEALKWRLLRDGHPIYGANTGFGDSSARWISTDRTTELQRNLVRYHLTGVGPTTPPEVVRATMLIRANCLARGHSGIRVDVIELLLDCLAHDILPEIPQRGSVGASGDLVPLCYLANVLGGDGTVRHRGQRREAAEALRACGLEPVELRAKEGLALVNGTSYMAAFAALAGVDASNLAEIAELCTALVVQALLGRGEPFEEFVHQQKPHPGQVASARAIARWLDGSALTGGPVRSTTAGVGPADGSFRIMDRGLQEPYSVRCAPHVIGVLRDTCDWVSRWLATEVNSSNDNPLFDVDAGVARNGGNFYGGHVGQAMDSLKVAMASVGDLLDRQLELIVDEKFSHGLTPNLIAPLDLQNGEAGLHHGFKGMQITCSALAAEALKMAAPATVFSRSTEAHNQDKVSMGTIAARDARAIVELVQYVTAIHLHALCQAADVRGPSRLSPSTRAAHELIRAHVPFVDRDRPLDEDVEAIVRLIRSDALTPAALERATELRTPAPARR